MEDTRILRSGVTASRFNYETRECRFRTTSDELHINFDIASKGGGRTDILLKIGAEDLKAMLTDAAHSIEQEDDLFVAAAAARVEAMRMHIDKATEQLDANREAAASNSTGLRDLWTGARRLRQDLYEMYLEAPDDDDEREMDVMNKAGELAERIQRAWLAMRSLAK